MKILVISDSHSQLDYIYDIIVQESPDSVICAGDHSTDAEAIAYAFPEIPFYIVKGNCDYYDTKNDNEMFVKIGNKFLFITHGHLYDAKKTYALLEKKGEELEADIVVFGHTHVQYFSERENLVLFNPGALKTKEYGIINIFQDSVEFDLRRINERQVKHTKSLC